MSLFSGVGDMESDNEGNANREKDHRDKEEASGNVNMNHDDLSDVSDLDDSIGAHSDEESLERQASRLRQQIGEIKKPDNEIARISEKTSRTEDGEEQLDFEAEDGECEEKTEPPKDGESKQEASVKESDELEEGEKVEENKKEREDLEEGEVTDEDDVRPEETEPRPVCRFFSRGQCTWGASCRFLHPGVTDKGMFHIIFIYMLCVNKIIT